jgi:hypothetical protein
VLGPVVVHWWFRVRDSTACYPSISTARVRLTGSSVDVLRTTFAVLSIRVCREPAGRQAGSAQADGGVILRRWRD